MDCRPLRQFLLNNSNAKQNNNIIVKFYRSAIQKEPKKTLMLERSTYLIHYKEYSN